MRLSAVLVMTSEPPSNSSGMRLAKRYTLMPGGGVGWGEEITTGRFIVSTFHTSPTGMSLPLHAERRLRNVRMPFPQPIHRLRTL